MPTTKKHDQAVPMIFLIGLLRVSIIHHLERCDWTLFPFPDGAFVYRQINDVERLSASNHKQSKFLIFESFQTHPIAWKWLCRQLIMLKQSPFAIDTNPR